MERHQNQCRPEVLPDVQIPDVFKSRRKRKLETCFQRKKLPLLMMNREADLC